MTRDRIQGQGQGRDTFKFTNSSISNSVTSTVYRPRWQMTVMILKLGHCLNLIGPDFSIYFLVFLSRDVKFSAVLQNQSWRVDLWPWVAHSAHIYLSLSLSYQPLVICSRNWVPGPATVWKFIYPVPNPGNWHPFLHWLRMIKPRKYYFGLSLHQLMIFLLTNV